MESSLRQRKVERSTVRDADTGDEDEKKRELAFQPSKNVSFGAAFAALLLARYFSATSNIVHDCDEVFNYWEPLHYLLYKSGFQTWEYSSEFALRSYLYLLLHAIIGSPIAWLSGIGPGKVRVFYMIKFFLGAMSAATEAALVAAVSLKFGKRVATYALAMLCFSSGCFTASTTFLPSTFSMYAISLASAALLVNKLEISVSVAAFGVLVGWPFSGLAVAPLVVYALLNGSFFRVFVAGFNTSILALVLSGLTDRFFYGEWKLSILNLVMYNVVGGGDSILYGVESPLFYLRNAFNNFNFALPLALGLPIILLISRKKATDKQLLLLTSPLFLWLAFMSLQPHKEERFLYPVYPLICVAASAAIERFPEMISASSSQLKSRVLKNLRPLTLTAILVLSYCRTTALLQGYSAPMEIYTHLPAHRETDSVVCVGSEWHRFPSSFFLPSPKYEVKWLDDGFRGALPLPFNGTTASAPAYFNNRNQPSVHQFVRDENTCDYLVELNGERGSNASMWKVIVQRKFVDKEKSPALHRALFIPWVWQRSNTFSLYTLLARKV